MRVRATSIYVISGIAKETNKPFGPIFKMTFLAPTENFSSDKFQKTAYGFDLIEQTVTKEFFEKFHKERPAFPAGGLELDLVTDQVPGRRGFETVVVDYKVATKPMAAAA